MFFFGILHVNIVHVKGKDDGLPLTRPKPRNEGALDIALFVQEFLS